MLRQVQLEEILYGQDLIVGHQRPLFSGSLQFAPPWQEKWATWAFGSAWRTALRSPFRAPGSVDSGIGSLWPKPRHVSWEEARA